VPASRLRGLVSEKAKLERQVKDLQDQMKKRATEGLTDMERMKLEKEELAAELKENEARSDLLETTSKQTMVRVHFGDRLVSPRVVSLVPLDLVEMDDTNELTASSKARLDAWARQAENKGLFHPERRAGNSPKAGDAASAITAEEYRAIMTDKTKTPAQKQQAHERYLASFASRNRA